MKKIISIGVALALLTMAVVPGAVAAATPPGCDPALNYSYPTTFAKIPFAIVASGLELVVELVPAIEAVMGGELPLPLDTMLPAIASWTNGPLSWTVDMMGWGLALFGSIFTVLDTELEMDMPWIGTLIDEVVCSLFTPFACIVGNNFTPCG